MRFLTGVLLSLAVLTSVGARDVRAQAPAAGAKPKVVLITGSTSGMGRELALEFGAQGATVIVHGRNRAQGDSVVAAIQKGGKGHAHFFAADFASFAQVRALADSVIKTYDHLDVLIDNAGFYDPNTPTRTITSDGNEQAFQVNYLAQMLLTERLKPLLVKSAPSRVVIIALGTQFAPDLADLNLEHDYTGSQGYGRSKAAGVMYAIDLAAELQPQGVIVNSVHPGTQMDTPMIVSLGRIPVTTIQQGTAAVMNAVNNDVGSGQLFQGLAQWRSPVMQVYDAAFRAQLRTIAMAAINGGKIPAAAPLAVLAPERSLVSWNTSSNPVNAYRIGADTTVAHAGRASLHVTGRGALGNPIATTAQSIRADQYRGKRVRYSAFFKTKDLSQTPGLGVGIWMRVDGNGGVMSFDNTQARWLKGTNDWTRMDIVLDVPDSAAGIALGTLLGGPGEAWVDDATLTVVGGDVPSTNTMQASSNPAQVAAQRQTYASAPLAPMNFDYEQLGAAPPPQAAPGPVAASTEKAPATWSGTSTPPDAYTFGLDRQTKHSGGSSGHVMFRGGAGSATLFQSFRAATYRGKRVRFTTWVQSRGLTTSATAGGVRLALQVAGNGGAMLASDNMQTRTIGGTTEWTQYSLVVDVPQGATAIQIGLAMAGPGEAWIDDASFEVVGTDVPMTGTVNPTAGTATQATPNEFLGLPTQPLNLDFEKANGP